MTISVQGNAQTAVNTIRVMVSETVELSAIEYVYTVTNYDHDLGNIYSGLYDFDDEDDGGDYNYEYNEEENEYETILKERKSITEISSILQKAKFTCKIIDDANYEVDPDEDEEDRASKQRQQIEIRVTTLAELKRLTVEVAKIDDAYGQISEVKYEDISSKGAIVYPKLMESATTKAKGLASAANKSLGNVVQIEEGTGGASIFGTQWQDYMDLIMSMRNIFGNEPVEHSKEVVVSMTYTFELK
jgi:hypothetical protein